MREKKDSSIQIRVGVTDLDSYNIVHHPQYLIWCEKAIWEWMREWASEKEMEGIGLFDVKKVVCKFCGAARLGEMLEIYVKENAKEEEFGGDKRKFSVRIENTVTKARVLEGDFEIAVRG